MTEQPDIYTRRYTPTNPVLGRHVAHDPRSWRFALRPTVNRSAWKTRLLRVYDPVPNPNQTIGDCTGCAKAMQFNTVGNRKSGVVLGLTAADQIYSTATRLDPFPGSWEPDDTGSNGLAASKAAQKLGIGGTYSWLNGADEVVETVVTRGRSVNVGTRWDEQMFDQDEHGFVHPGGPVAGGHEWLVRGYSKEMDAVRGRCWWGEFRDFWIKREDLDALLHDDGDAHIQDRVK